MVVFEPPKKQKGKCGKDSDFPALPGIFGEILGKTVENEDVEKENCVEENKKASAEEPTQAPKLVKLPSSQAFKKGHRPIQDVLDVALSFVPQQSKKPAPKEKAKAKAKANTNCLNFPGHTRDRDDTKLFHVTFLIIFCIFLHQSFQCQIHHVEYVSLHTGTTLY